MTTFRTVLLAVLAMALACAPTSAAEVSVKATLQPERISTDDDATLDIIITGSGNVSIELPQIPNLQLRNAGVSRNYSWVNGRSNASLTQRYLVTAAVPGEYEIPPVIVRSDSDEAKTTTLRLTVTQGSGRPNRHAPQLAPPSGFGVSPAPAPDAAQSSNLAFLEVNPAKSEAYVGELIPVEVKAYFRDGIRMQLRSAPAVEGGSFTLKNQEGEAPRRRVTVDGVSYVELTFYSAVAATKPGAFPLPVGMDVTALVPQQSSRQRSGSMLEQLFGGFFGSRTVPQEIALAADPIPMEIKPLPDLDKPDTFSGAVGEFTVAAGTKVTEVAAGEPVTVNLQVEGKGNFDRVAAPKLPRDDRWKSYPSSARFVPADSIGQTGVKRFELVIAPQDPDITEIPPFEFVYFDPEVERYETARTEPIPLEVTGTLPRPAEPEIAAAETMASGSDPAVDPISESLGLLRGTRPLYTSPWFVVANGTSLLILAAGGMLIARRKRGVDPAIARRAARARALQDERQAMDSAVAAGEAPAFFAAARHFLQLRIAGDSGAAPESITGSDTGDPVAQEVFAAADAVRYSGAPMTPEELAAWREKLDEAAPETPLTSQP
ncbi:hypothetical protein BH23VER1_BH23VER1_07550 [soil metagenome]